MIPLFSAGLALALYRRPNLQRIVSVTALSLVLAASITLLVLADDGPLVVDVGDWAAPVGINLVADRLSALMLTISAAVTLCVLLYSLAQGSEDDEESAPVSIYHPTYLVLAAGVADAFLSGRPVQHLRRASRSCSRPPTCSSRSAAAASASARGPSTSSSRCSARCCSSSRSR